jgi:hypothetical protein
MPATMAAERFESSMALDLYLAWRSVSIERGAPRADEKGKAGNGSGVTDLARLP